MRSVIWLLSSAVLLVACGREEAIEPTVEVKTESAVEPQLVVYDEAAEIKRAQQAITLFAGSLQAEFGTAMRNDGAVAAIKVCNTEASLIAERISAEMGLQLGRVSLQPRNPVNQPDDWQTPVLLEFEKRFAEGENPAYISWSETVGEGADREFHFMKPIPTHSLCLECHGKNLTPEVKATLASMYPEDMATGFSEGEIRGAFVVTSFPGQE